MNIILLLIFSHIQYVMLALTWCFKYLTLYESTHCLVYFSEASRCKYNGALNNFMTVHKIMLLLQIPESLA